MKSPRSQPTLSPDVAAYIAGLIDGEGTVTLTRLHANEQRRLVVSIANTERQLLEYVRVAFGAGKITSKKAYSERHSLSYCYAITSRQALSLLEQVLPFLRSYKRARAALAIRHYLGVTPRNGKYTPAILERRQEFENIFLSMHANDCQEFTKP